MAKEKIVRANRISYLINDEEKQLIDSYLRKYKISNKSRWMREVVLSFIIKNLDKDYPSLFSEQDMRR